MMDDKTILFEKTPVPKAVMQLAVPTILSSLVMVIYNLADTYFVGMMNNPVQNAAVTLAAPVLLAFNAVNNLFGVGSSSMMSRALGRRDYESVRRSSAFGFYCALFFGLLFSVLCTVGLNPLLILLGADANTMDATAGYLKWTVLFGAAPAILNVVMAYMVRSEGSSLHASIGTMSGCLLNIILDPVFIFVFGMGVRGAALATILSQAVSAIWVCHFLTGRKTTIKIKPSRMRLKKEYVVGIISLGISPFIMQSTESLLNITLNASLQFYGGDMAVGAMTIIGSISQLGLMPLMGLTQGGQPIISYNYGARNYDRVRKAYHLMIAASFTLSMVIWAIVEFFPEVVIAIFTTDPQLSSLTVWAIRIFMMCIGIMGLQTGCQQTFLSLGQAKVSVFLAMLRKLILLIPLILIIPRVTGLGMTGVFLAQPIADFIAVVSTVAVFAVKIRKIIPRPAKTA